MRPILVCLLTLFVVGRSAVVAGQSARPARPSPSPSEPARAADMRDHYTSALALHTAVIDGRLPAVAKAASVLTRYVASGSPLPASGAAVETIRQQARAAAAARDIVGAAYATATMLSACGDCHRASGVMPAVPLAPPPRVGTIVGHMLEHQRAADQMLQGLLVPSTSLWTSGAKGFVTAPLRARDLTPESERDRRMVDTEQRLHRIAGDAAQATDAKSRAGFYAQLLAGCADCHRR